MVTLMRDTAKLVINKENKRELLDMPMLEIMHLQQYRVILALFGIFIPYR